MDACVRFNLCYDCVVKALGTIFRLSLAACILAVVGAFLLIYLVVDDVVRVSQELSPLRVPALVATGVGVGIVVLGLQFIWRCVSALMQDEKWSPSARAHLCQAKNCFIVLSCYLLASLGLLLFLAPLQSPAILVVWFFVFTASLFMTTSTSLILRLAGDDRKP